MQNTETLQSILTWLETEEAIPFAQKRTPIDIEKDVTDCYEFSRIAGLNMFPQNLRCVIRYENSYREVTSREVVLTAVYAFNGSRYFEAFCSLRDDVRSFKYENIRHIESNERIIFDASTSLNTISEWIGVDISYQGLSQTDFFVHPQTWGCYRRPISVLMASLREQGASTDKILSLLFEFCSSSMKNGIWSGFRDDQKAMALSLLGLRIDTTWLNPVDGYRAIRGGKFSKRSFDLAFEKAQAGVL